MKLQCPCGAKYAFDVTPEMAREPVRFICPACGLDSSAFVNQLIQQELGLPPAPTTAAPAPAIVSAPAPVRLAAAAPAPTPAVAAAPAPAAPAAPRLSISRGASTGTAAPAAAAVVEGGKPCPKHPRETAVEHCRVCQKPICRQCMELFGYVCSPLCRARATSHGIEVPIFEGQRSVADAKRWRKLALIGGSATAVVVLILGLWFWYAWFGSVPSPMFSVRFPEMAYAGTSQMCGKDDIVFLHGGTLARYGLKSKKPVWTVSLIDKKDLAAEVEKQMNEAYAALERAKRSDSTYMPRIPLRADVEKWVQIRAETSLKLLVADQNVWVQKEDRLTRYDWQTGQPGQEVTLPRRFGRPLVQDNELVFLEENEVGQHLITRVSLTTGQSNREEMGVPLRATVAAAPPPRASGARTNTATAARGSTGGRGLPTTPGKDMDKPLDPGRVAAEAQNLSTAEKAALPAVLANTMHQERLFRELREPESGRPRAGTNNYEPPRYFMFLPSKHGHIQWHARMIEERITSRKAMKEAPPASESALNKNPSVANSMEIANEILNEMQRSAGGDTVEEDESRYQVTLRRPNTKDVPDWVGEVIGPPAVYPQKTVTVIAGGKMIVVLDKSNRKLWQADLGYSIPPAYFGAEEEGEGAATSGLGPCVERDDTLYVFDETTLIAFDLNTGNVRWRIPSIGISGFFFDHEGMMYVNSTSARLESIKYSRQIDVTASTTATVFKVDPKTGSVLWSVNPGGYISHVDGKFIYCLAMNQAEEIDPDSFFNLGQMSSLLAIRRLHPKTGKTVWDHVQKRCPYHVRFHGNMIELVFKKEVQVLKFLSF